MTKFEEYANPDVLVTTDWVADRLDQFQSDDSKLRLIEVDVDTEAYDSGHVPGTTGWNWQTQLCDQVKRDLTPRDELEELMAGAGVRDDSTIVLYGDNHNWFAAWAFWQLKYYGFDDVCLMDGGRAKWLAEKRELTEDIPSFSRGEVHLEEPDEAIRTFSHHVRERLGSEDMALVDVRSREEFTGEQIAPEGMNETAQRGGHIPGAVNISWSEAVNDDGTFKTAAELEELYQSRGVTPDKETVAYCRIGERSSHTWFVLDQLLGYDVVRNYDGSWTEWGNLVGAPIERGE